MTTTPAYDCQRHAACSTAVPNHPDSVTAHSEACASHNRALTVGHYALSERLPCGCGPVDDGTAVFMCGAHARAWRDVMPPEHLAQWDEIMAEGKRAAAEWFGDTEKGAPAHDD